ncbi:MAG: four helix bundle protein [Bacteroidota bacterium]
MKQQTFNELFRKRTKKMALSIIHAIQPLPKSNETNIISRQVIRSATSVAANFRAVCRARSEAERFAKLCIVVEEADETLFWLELIQDLYPDKKYVSEEILKESESILKTMAAFRRKLKQIKSSKSQRNIN